MRIKISELPSGTAEQNAVVPATNAIGSATRKVKMGEIAALATKQTVGLGDVDNTSDANKPVSTAVQIALDGKAPLNNPTFTGIVGGITKSMVGLGDVDNISDANKPISTATQTALDGKVSSSAVAVSLGKTLSVLNSITFSSTDGALVNLGAGGSVLYSNSIIDGGQY